MRKRTKPSSSNLAMDIRDARVELIKNGGGETIGAISRLRIGIWAVLVEPGVPSEYFADREDAVALIKHIERQLLDDRDANA